MGYAVLGKGAAQRALALERRRYLVVRYFPVINGGPKRSLLAIAIGDLYAVYHNICSTLCLVPASCLRYYQRGVRILLCTKDCLLQL